MSETKKEKKLIIFDVDGTIWDSEKDVFLSFNHTLKENTNMEITKEQFQELAGLHLGEMFRKVLPEEEKEKAEEYEKKYKKYYIDEGHYVDATTLFENVKETIENFKSQGFQMAVASSKPKRILDEMVEHFGLNEFELVLGTEESNFKHKPDPEILNYIMNELNIPKEETVIVGDSKTDIVAGKNAGIDTIAVTYGYDKPENLRNLNPTYIVDDFKSLEKVIKYKNNE